MLTSSTTIKQVVWTAIFFHWVYTYAAQVVASGVTRSPLYNWLEYTPYMLAALVVALLWRGASRDLLPKKSPQLSRAPLGPRSRKEVFNDEH